MVSELDTDTIKNMVASLKILGLEKMRHICEYRLIPKVTGTDIENFVSQAGLGSKVNIDWLHHLDEAGVKKIAEIVGNLIEQKNEIFAKFRMGICHPEIEIFKEKIEWDFCKSLEICVHDKALYLREEFRLIGSVDTVLLKQKELIHLFSNVGDGLADIDSSKILGNEHLIHQKIVEANHSNLKLAGEKELELFVTTMWSQREEKKFINANIGCLIQIIFQCLNNKKVGNSSKLMALQLFVTYFSLKKGDITYRLDQNIKPADHVVGAPSDTVTHTHLADSEIENKQELNRDVQNSLFAHMSTIKDQWRFARTSKANYHAYATFCKSNLNEQINRLQMNDMSWIKLFLSSPQHRKDPFVPLCQVGKNSLAHRVLGPNTIEKIRNGMPIAEAQEILHQYGGFYHGLKDYRRDGSLSEEWVKQMKPAERDDLDNCLGNRLVKFAINSGQLTIEQAYENKDFFSSRRFFNIGLGRREEGKVDFLFENSKLTVRRFLELSDDQLQFVVQYAIFEFIKQGQLTVDAALYLYALIEKYNQSGWYGISMMHINKRPEKKI